MKALSLLVLFLVLFGVSEAQYGLQQAVNMTFQQFSWGGTWANIWTLVHLPDDYNTTSANTRYPLLIMFHGAGENSANNQLSDLINVAKYGPCAQLKANKLVDQTVNGVTYKFIVVCPQAVSGWWSPADGYPVNSFLNKVISLYPKADLNRIYLTGLSAGGWTTINYISGGGDGSKGTTYASRIAAVVVQSADVPESVKYVCNAVAARVPLWDITGTSDALNSANVQMVTRYNACPYKVYNGLYTGIQGKGHNGDVWGPAYTADHSWNNPNIYEWMLQYTRSGLPASTTTIPPAASTTSAATTSSAVTKSSTTSASSTTTTSSTTSATGSSTSSTSAGSGSSASTTSSSSSTTSSPTSTSASTASSSSSTTSSDSTTSSASNGQSDQIGTETSGASGVMIMFIYFVALILVSN